MSRQHPRKGLQISRLDAAPGPMTDGKDERGFRGVMPGDTSITRSSGMDLRTIHAFMVTQKPHRAAPAKRVAQGIPFGGRQNRVPSSGPSISFSSSAPLLRTLLTAVDTG